MGWKENLPKNLAKQPVAEFLGQSLMYIVMANKTTLAATNAGTTHGEYRLNGRKYSLISGPRGAMDGCDDGDDTEGLLVVVDDDVCAVVVGVVSPAAAPLCPRRGVTTLISKSFGVLLAMID